MRATSPNPCIWHSPAKINLYLAVTGIRPLDGFHELDSLVALLDFGDTLEVKPSPDGCDHFQCDPPVLEWSPNNLIRLALELYRARTGFCTSFNIQLKKRIPLGAGLGGGSSNATTLLCAVNSLNPQPVDRATLLQWSTELGSDCALFFKQGLIRMRGRGERVECMEPPLYERLSSMRILIFHPGFAVSAGWAYKQLRADYPAGYTDPDSARREIEAWFATEAPWLNYARNDLSAVVDRKYLAIPALRQHLLHTCNQPSWMSGSGSACFCLLQPDVEWESIKQIIRACWGAEAFVETARLLPVG